MRTKLLYVLVSGPEDIYLEQAYISMMSAKHHMKDVHIVLITDSITNESFTIPGRDKILNLISEKIVIDLPSNLSGQNRSRLLKTSCRRYVKGNFLFIDCDTIILQALDPIDDCQSDIAACRDSHSSFTSNPYRNMCLKHCSKIGIDISNEKDYFNSGVIFVKDSDIAHNFYSDWNKNWKKGRDSGIFMDQPAFAKTNIEYNHIIEQLPDIWNCQIIHGIKFLPNAFILHYLCTSKTKYNNTEMFLLRDKNILNQIKETNNIPEPILQSFDDPFVGIPDLVHVLSGTNVNLCQTATFKFMENIHGSILFKCLDIIFKYISYFLKLKKHIINSFNENK